LGFDIKKQGDNSLVFLQLLPLAEKLEKPPGEGKLFGTFCNSAGG
jgi:hypothetical protein